LVDFLCFGEDDGSVLNLAFDAVSGPDGELDFALRVSGDQTELLQRLIDAGQLAFSGNRQDVELIYDATNDFTSVGFFTVVVRGDVNLDEDVTFADIPPFIAVLQAGNFQAEADCNVDGEVTFADIPAFIAILIGQ